MLERQGASLEALAATSSFQDRLAERERIVGVVGADKLHTPLDRLAQYMRLEQMVGNTPLDWRPLGENSLWVKVESENPTESHYDRAALRVIKRLEDEGLIRPGDTILEGTSGSAGRSFAYFCNRLGFKLDLLVPHEDEFPLARERDIKALGANVIHVEGRGGIARVAEAFRGELLKLSQEGFQRRKIMFKDGKPLAVYTRGDEVVCVPNHSEIIMTPLAFGDIATEALDQLPDGRTIDVFIGTLGNGSTMKGITDVLRTANPQLIVIGTEHRSAPTNAIRKLRAEVGEGRLRAEFMRRYGFRMPELDEQMYHDSFGASTPGYEPPFVEVDKIDRIVLLGDEWRDLKRRANTYALLNHNPAGSIGNTSAENLYVALQIPRVTRWKGKNVMIISYDKGDQYSDWPPEQRIYAYPLPVQPTIDSIPSGLQNMQAAA